MGLEQLVLQPSQKFIVHNAVATLPVPTLVTDGAALPKLGGGSPQLRRMLLKFKPSIGTATLTSASVFVYFDGEWTKLQLITPDLVFAAGDANRSIIVDLLVGDRIYIAGTIAGGTFTITAYPLEVLQ
jgi:hypothetical protein